MTLPEPELSSLMGENRVDELLAAVRDDHDLVGFDDPASGDSLLHVAARAGCADLGAFLIGHGARAEAPNNAYWTPLHYAAWHGQVEFAGKLMKLGVDVNARTLTRLQPHWRGAASPPVNPNACFSAAMSPLHLAARRGHLAFCQLLLDHHGDPRRSEEFGLPPSALAADAGHRHVVRFLLPRMIRVRRRVGIAQLVVPVHMNIKCRDWAYAEDHFITGTDIDEEDAEGWTPIFHAVKGEWAGAVSHLIGYGANLSHKDHHGRTPQMLANERRGAEMTKDQGDIIFAFALVRRACCLLPR